MPRGRKKKEKAEEEPKEDKRTEGCKKMERWNTLKLDDDEEGDGEEW